MCSLISLCLTNTLTVSWNTDQGPLVRDEDKLSLGWLWSLLHLRMGLFISEMLHCISHVLRKCHKSTLASFCTKIPSYWCCWLLLGTCSGSLEMEVLGTAYKRNTHVTNSRTNWEPLKIGQKQKFTYLFIYLFILTFFCSVIWKSTNLPLTQTL